MRCPFCHHEESKVTDSRNAEHSYAIRRRRECLACLRRFTTFETVDLTIQVHKRDGRYEDFQQDKEQKQGQAGSKFIISRHWNACKKVLLLPLFVRPHQVIQGS